MKILKEAYTRDEIKERVLTTRNIMQALIDSLYILSDSLDGATADKDRNEKLNRYTNGYIRDLKDISTDFEDDFEDFIEDRVEEVEIEDEIEIDN